MPGYQRARRFKDRIVGIGSTGEDWARVVMNRETRELVRSLRPETLSALEISGTAWETWAQFKSYRNVHYPDFDICKDRLDERFDFIVAEQVFEHLLWPYRAAKNVYEMLSPGGHFLVTTPFLLRLHNLPDCTRWTETGMRHLLAEAGFNLAEVRTGSWGNRACVRANFQSWVSYRPWLHSLKREDDFPITVWALARK